MIPKAHLVHWQRYAPWIEEIQIEQDLILSRIIIEIYSDPFLREQILVIIGVCHTRGAEKMNSVVKGRGIKYPVCADRFGITTSAYKVDSFPDYYLIDRQGKLRIADCKTESLEEAIKILLSEKTPNTSS